MLVFLSIRDFAIVESLELEWSAGFTVLTGETGAGKSILVDALSLILGGRGDAGSVREGAKQADLSAQFTPNAAADALLLHHGLEDEGQCLMRRVIDKEGRSRAFVNGRAVTLAVLRELGEQLVDIHGQHAHQSLTKPESQRALLDQHAGLSETVSAVATNYATWRAAARARDAASAEAANRATERERLAWQVGELATLAMLPGEWEAVQAQHKRLNNSSALLSGAQGLIGGLEEGDDAIVPRLAALAAKARALAEMDSALQEVADALQPAAISAEEAARSLSRYLGRAEADPARLGEVEARMGAIHGMARKFRLNPAELPEKRMEWQSRLDELDAAGDAVALEKREAEAQASYRASAKTLSAARKKAAKKLAQEVTQAMQTLAMDGGKFDIALEPLEGGSAAGDERVEFLVAGHAGTTPRPIAKVASGGELARIGLAIQVIAAQGTAVPTLIFDEVDSGIGGRVAEVVGRLLAQLGEHRQVLAVTHLPQVAACGAQHFTVAKTSSKQGTTSSVRALSKAERVDEVARMLGGIEVTAATKKAAKEMLQ